MPRDKFIRETNLIGRINHTIFSLYVPQSIPLKTPPLLTPLSRAVIASAHACIIYNLLVDIEFYNSVTLVIRTVCESGIL